MTDTRAPGKAMSPRSYDLLSRAAGVSDAQWQLVAQAGIRPSATVLEIGAGTGNVLLKIKRAAPAALVIGLDADRASLDVAAGKAADAHVEVQLDQGDASHLPYPDGTFDRVLSSFVLHHLAYDQKIGMLEEIRRVLKADGSMHLLDFLAGTRRFPDFALLSGRRQRGHQHHHQPWDGSPRAADPLGLMAQAGLVDRVHVNDGTSRLGRHSFYRASK